eukprot:1966658-Prymnesium_polylepis.2
MAWALARSRRPCSPSRISTAPRGGRGRTSHEVAVSKVDRIECAVRIHRAPLARMDSTACVPHGRRMQQRVPLLERDRVSERLDIRASALVVVALAERPRYTHSPRSSTAAEPKQAREKLATRARPSRLSHSSVRGSSCTGTSRLVSVIVKELCAPAAICAAASSRIARHSSAVKSGAMEAWTRASVSNGHELPMPNVLRRTSYASVGTTAAVATGTAGAKPRFRLSARSATCSARLAFRASE